MIIREKKILIISPSKWGDMYISKHHYSIELARLGNKVIFLEPVVIGKFGKVFISNPRADFENLQVATPSMPKWMEIMRFKQRIIYDFFCKYYIKTLLRNLGIDFDIVWCFETNLYSNLKGFQAKFIIYHPVDIGVYEYQQKIAAGSDITFTVSESLAIDFKKYNKNTFFINHGLSEDFAITAMNSLHKVVNNQNDSKVNLNSPINIGFVGNLFRTELNRDFFYKIIKDHPQLRFIFWGPIEIENSNVDGLLTNETLEFVSFLKGSENVNLKGVKRGMELIDGIKDCEILLLALNHSMMYDGSNSHKILEYLSTGNTIVSHYVSTYANLELLQMANDDSTTGLLMAFNEALINISNLNCQENRLRRINYALDNTYSKQIQRIEERISQLKIITNV